MLSDLLRRIDLSIVPGVSVGWHSPATGAVFQFQGRTRTGGPEISAETIWEAASLSKPVVASLALYLAAETPELLTQPLFTSADDFGAAPDDRWADLTLTHCLTHTTGFPNWRPLNAPLEFEAALGTAGYSGEGYELLLTELSTRTAAVPEALLEAHLERLGLTNSSFTPNLADDLPVAVGHTDDRFALPKAPVTTPRASGSLHTTVQDYLTFLSLVAQPGSHADAQVRGGLRRLAEPHGESGRTLGWAVSNTAAGDVLWQHGDNPGFKHIAAVKPQTSEALVVFTNGDAGQTIYREICRQLLDADVW